MLRSRFVFALLVLASGPAYGWPSGDDDGDRYEEPADCDDRDPDVYPGAPEVTNGIDDDCDGLVDEGTPTYDDDGDGFTEDGGDCDDAEVTVWPDAPEAPNGVDDDCDGVVDEGTAAYDDDGDGASEDAGDCDDANAAAHPDAEEIENGTDDNCDGNVDETGVVEDEPPPKTEPAGGCAHAPPMGLVGVLLALALTRRR